MDDILSLALRSSGIDHQSVGQTPKSSSGAVPLVSDDLGKLVATVVDPVVLQLPKEQNSQANNFSKGKLSVDDVLGSFLDDGNKVNPPVSSVVDLNSLIPETVSYSSSTAGQNILASSDPHTSALLDTSFEALFGSSAIATPDPMTEILNSLTSSTPITTQMGGYSDILGKQAVAQLMPQPSLPLLPSSSAMGGLPYPLAVSHSKPATVAMSSAVPLTGGLTKTSIQGLTSALQLSKPLVQLSPNLTLKDSVKKIDFISSRSGPTEEEISVKQVLREVKASEGIAGISEEVEAEAEVDDDFLSGDTYATYKPSKLKIGYPHPDPVVESSTLSSVEPPSVWLDLTFPVSIIEEKKLSALQLEAVVYTCQQHMNILGNGCRAGFLVGDGAGVGKGRIIAGIIYQNYLDGRKKAVWLSVSNDLKYDAMRDLHDVGAKKLQVYALNKFRYGKISGKRNDRVKKGVIFSTYSALIGKSTSGGKYSTRLNQLLHWLGTGFDGLIVLDECHKAKNLFPSKSGKPSKTGTVVLELQERLPKARIVYCSATGASEPRNMGYMSRLGIWGKGTQFDDFLDFLKAVERRGVGAMELVAMDMKLRGAYIARQLSFHGVSFQIKEVQLSEDFIDMYDAAVDIWVEAKRKFEEAAQLLDIDVSHMWSLFWAAHQRFFKYLCIAAKVKEAIALAKKSIKEGKCVVIGLQSTGEARTLEQLEQARGELTEFVSTAKGVFESLIKKHFPTAEVKSSLFHYDLFDDPTLPASLRKRLRGEEVASSDSEDDSDFSNDSESSDTDSDTDSDSPSSDDNDDSIDPFKMFEAASHRKKPQAKKRKLNKEPLKSSGKPSTSRRHSIAIPSLMKEEKPYLNLIGRSHSNQPSPRSLATGGSLRDSLASFSSAQTEGLVESAKHSTDPAARSSVVAKLKDELLQKLHVLSPYLPHNTLDELIKGLGGPLFVSEMTGRRGRLVSQPNGTVKYQLRSQGDIPVEMMNLAEKQAFMDGEKDVAIISEAASSGISLHADRREKNQKRRVHITLELPWSADKAIQQFGRTHRSNQTSAPEYVFLISALAGEKRFASTVSKRLESLGALTHGDRRAGETRDLSRFNIDTKYGRAALELVLQSVVGISKSLVSGQDYNADFFSRATTALIGAGLLHRNEYSGKVDMDKDASNISKFLNRLLGVPVKLQNQIFSYFTDTLNLLILQAKRMGKWDGGIVDFGSGGENVEIVTTEEFIGDPAFRTATTYLNKVLIERGVSYQSAVERLEHERQPGEGFYISKRVYAMDRKMAILVKSADVKENLYLITRPNTGVSAKHEKLSAIQAKYKKVTPEEAQVWWEHQYTSSNKICQHLYTLGKCKLSLFGTCNVGLRRREHFILSGSVLGIWNHLEGVFSRHHSQNYKMQIVRIQTREGRKLVGIEIPTSCLSDLHKTLTTLARQVAGEEHLDPGKPLDSAPTSFLL